MKKLTKLWVELNDCLADVDGDEKFTTELYDRFGEIFDRKDVLEYKTAAATDVMSPKQFQHTSSAMRRALVEGYLLAQMEQSRDNIQHLYKCYREEIDNDKETFSIDNYPNIPRCSISGTSSGNNL